MKRSPLTREPEGDYAITYLLAPPHLSRRPPGQREKIHIAINVITGDFWRFSEVVGEWREIDSAGPTAMHVKAEIVGVSIGNGHHLTFGELERFHEILDHTRIGLGESVANI